MAAVSGGCGSSEWWVWQQRVVGVAPVSGGQCTSKWCSKFVFVIRYVCVSHGVGRRHF